MERGRGRRDKSLIIPGGCAVAREKRGQGGGEFSVGALFKWGSMANWPASITTGSMDASFPELHDSAIPRPAMINCRWKNPGLKLSGFAFWWGAVL
jgi:hypothetical protein